MNTKNFVGTTLCSILLILPSSGHGADSVRLPLAGTESQCLDLVRDCLLRPSSLDRASCLTSAKKHPFCDGSGVVSLITKRLLFSAPIIEDTEGAAALLGSSSSDLLTNNVCVRDCDTHLIGLEIPSDVSLSDIISSTSSCYERCKLSISPLENERP